MPTVSLGNFFNTGGKTVIGGIGGSGLDTESLINALIEAKSVPKVKLEDKIEINDNKITAFGELRTLLSTFKDAANFLRNPPGVGNEADNVFKYRSAELTSNTSIGASTYLGVNVQPGASVQNYTISDISSIAKAKKQKTGSFMIADAETSAVTSAATAGFFKAGTVTINGANITLAAGDSLNTVVAKFNEQKATTGIEATILQVDDSEFVISFSATETGEDADFDLNDPATVTADPSGVLSMISRTNLLTNGTFDSSIAGWTNASVGTGSIAYNTNAMELNGDGAGNEAFAQQAMTTSIGQQYTVRATLSDLASSAFIRIGSGSDVTLGTNFDVEDYEVLADGTVEFTFTATSTTTYLTVNSANNTDPITLDDISVVASATDAVTDTQAASNAEFKIDGVDIVRQTNTISDLVDGVTFSILQTTPALTEIDVDIVSDNELPKSGVINFVNAFNELRIFVAKQTEVLDSGEFAEDAYLARDTTLRSTINSINAELSAVVAGIGGSGFRTLADIGVTFTDLPKSEDNPFTRNILTVDEEKLENAIAANFDEVEALFSFQFTSNNSNLISFSRTNAITATSFSLNLNPGTDTFQATIGATTVDLVVTELANGAGYTLKGPSGSAIEGLTMVYGSSAAASINISLTQGIGDRIFNALETVLNTSTGTLELQVDSIETSTTRFEDEIARIDDQIEKFRDQLLRKFGALETIISSVNTLLTSLDAAAAARENG